MSRDRVTLAALRELKAQGRKIVGVVAWDTHMARLAERAGADIVSVGDSVGVNLWGHSQPLAVTMDEMLVVCRAVRAGVDRAMVSGDLPFGPLQESPRSALGAAIRFVKEAGVDMVKLDGAAEHLDAVALVDRAGIPVFAQLGLTPQTALRLGVEYSTTPRLDLLSDPRMVDEIVSQARRLERAGASVLDLTNCGETIGRAVVEATSVPVLGGLGGGPWLDGRLRMAHVAIGYGAANVDEPHPGAYRNGALDALDAISAYVDDVREARPIRGDASHGASRDASQDRRTE